MKREHKELLIKDLCARLPYGVKLQCTSDTITCVGPYTLDTIVLDRFCNENTEYVPFDEVKPYLFPLSSMTEEQQLFYSTHLNYMPYYQRVDWFNEHHLDYRGLIPMGLVLDATNLNVY